MKNIRFRKGVSPTAIYGIISVLAAALAIIIFFFIITTPNETHTSNDNETDSIKVLYCKSSNPDNPFFKYNNASTIHEIKITFSNEKVDKYNYTYSVKFSSNNDAEAVLSHLHADYNNYMGTTNVYQEDLSPTFSVIDSKVLVNIFISKKYFTSTTARFVFIDNNEYAEIQNMTVAEIKQMYENKKFSCDYNY